MTSAETVLTKTSLLWSIARSAHFTFQQRALPVLEYAVTGRRPRVPPNRDEFLKTLFKELFELLKQDSAAVGRGDYPWTVLMPENPLRHLSRTVDILRDGISLAKRRRERKHDDFDASTREMLENFPEYYTRNFHYQTDGYFSDHSAEIYEHQVEILFAGAADPMRRVLIQDLKKRLPGDGKGLRMLEIGAGTGRLSRFMKLAYPKAQITLLDPSSAYLKKAREQLQEFSDVNFVQGFGEDLNFKSNIFDVVYSCFLFHELPFEVRKSIVSETHRVLKHGGLWCGGDSLQLGDNAAMDWSLKQFPKDFHEPFYTDYIKKPLQDFLSLKKFDEISTHSSFLMKTVLARKKEDPKKRR